jgi:hypothetical protein
MQDKASFKSNFESIISLIVVAFTAIDFHPHWHIIRPPLGYEYQPPPPLILDPITRHRRRTEEAERRAHERANNRLRIAQTGRILSQFEQRGPVLRHCSACTEVRHDKAACQGCRSTGHIRSSCPFVPRSTPLLSSTVVDQYSLRLHSNIASQPSVIQQQGQWEGDFRSTQFSRIWEDLDESIVPATQY